MTMTMEEYDRRMHDDNRSGLVPPEIPGALNFELKGHILAYSRIYHSSGRTMRTHINTLMRCWK